MSTETTDLQTVNNAKNEYLMSLHKIVSPFVLRFVNDEYVGAVEFAGHRKSLKEFQRALTRVPEWNHAVIVEKTQAIEQKHPVLSNLVAAVFVSFVKILSSIRISSSRPKIKLRIPSNDKFVHKVYVLAAKKFYEDPMLASQGREEDKREAIYEAVENAVRDMIPMEDILSAYLSTTVDGDNAVNPILSPPPSENDEDEDDDVIESDHEEEPKVIDYSPASKPFEPAAVAMPVTGISNFSVGSGQIDATQSSFAAYPGSQTQVEPVQENVVQPRPLQGGENTTGQLQVGQTTAPPLQPGPIAQPVQPARPLFPDAEDGDDHFQ